MEKDNAKEELKPREGGMVKVVCAWCGAGQEKVRPGDRVSHGICDGCAERVRDQLPQANLGTGG
jgi:hypothetical protein